MPLQNLRAFLNKLEEQARRVYDDLRKIIPCTYDKSGSVGRRYARADEIGVPFCVTVDFDTEKEKSVTIRDRDSTKQVRVQLADLKNTLYELIVGTLDFGKAGKAISQKS